jgi:hypothetical protein
MDEKQEGGVWSGVSQWSGCVESDGVGGGVTGVVCGVSGFQRRRRESQGLERATRQDRRDTVLSTE